VLPIAHAVACLGNGNEREAHLQVCPDEIKASLLDFGLESLRCSWNTSAHIHI
jgi:hypothetical protein